MKLPSVIIKLFFTAVLIWLAFLIYNIDTKQYKKQPKNIDKIYPDSIQVLTIDGDTATIYGMTGHRMLIIRNPKSK